MKSSGLLEKGLEQLKENDLWKMLDFANAQPLFKQKGYLPVSRKIGDADSPFVALLFFYFETEYIPGNSFHIACYFAASKGGRGIDYRLDGIRSFIIIYLG